MEGCAVLALLSLATGRATRDIAIIATRDIAIIATRDIAIIGTRREQAEQLGI